MPDKKLVVHQFQIFSRRGRHIAPSLQGGVKIRRRSKKGVSTSFCPRHRPDLESPLKRAGRHFADSTTPLTAWLCAAPLGTHFGGCVEFLSTQGQFGGYRDNPEVEFWIVPPKGKRPIATPGERPTDDADPEEN